MLFKLQCLCLGDGWIAVGTDKRLIRIFSIGGIQKEIFSVPGPVVSVSGHSTQLLVVYHRGIGQLYFYLSTAFALGSYFAICGVNLVHVYLIPK